MSIKKTGLLALFCLPVSFAQAPQYDLVIIGGTLFDGRGRLLPDRHVANIRPRLASGEWIAAKNSLI